VTPAGHASVPLLTLLLLGFLEACSRPWETNDASDVERISGCPASLAMSTHPALAGTDLPKNFAECVRAGGMQDDDHSRCSFGAARHASPKLYGQCVAFGGSRAVACGRAVAVYTCGIEYQCGWRPCPAGGCD
jgi:hypothetical protein